MPFLESPDLRLHYLERPGPGRPRLVLHGLSANAHCFDAVELEGAAVLPDLRGRGLSDQPERGYTLEDHARDLLPLCGEGAALVGHSFGGLLALYLAARHPEAVGSLVLLDSAVGVLGPGTLATIGPSLARLRQVYDSFEDYLRTARAAGWPAAAEGFFRADLRQLEDGRYACRTRPETIEQVVEAAGAEDWSALARQVRQPVRLLRARQGIVTPEALALTREALPQLETQEVEGDHFSMLYGGLKL